MSLASYYLSNLCSSRPQEDGQLCSPFLYNDLPHHRHRNKKANQPWTIPSDSPSENKPFCWCCFAMQPRILLSFLPRIMQCLVSNWVYSKQTTTLMNYSPMPVLPPIHSLSYLFQLQRQILYFNFYLVCVFVWVHMCLSRPENGSFLLSWESQEWNTCCHAWSSRHLHYTLRHPASPARRFLHLSSSSLYHSIWYKIYVRISKI